ncbi:prepilin peptidase [Aeromicrobium sp. CF3.5]|uniref:prepilin peptidase n=1 Tax=Aeromicrobium sp. CF3.5 TaxID=3373078 RepID=UPI003EE45809
MDPVLLVALSAVAAAAIALAGPRAILALPEPAEPEPDKIPYAQVATIRGIRWWLAVPAAIGAGVVAWRIEVPELMPVWIVLAGVGAWLSFIDWHTRYLPFVLVVPLYVLVLTLTAIGAAWARDVDLVVHALIGNVALYAIYRAMHWLAARFFGGAFGYGDVRLSAVIGLALGALGLAETVVGGYVGFLLGGILGAILARLGLVDRSGFAFGPYMLLGAVIGVAAGGVLYA